MQEEAKEKIKIGSEVGVKVNCAMCQKEGTTNEFTTLQGQKGENVHLCADCKEKVNTEFESERKNPNILLALVGGAVGATIGGIIWYLVAVGTGREIGYISLALGYLVGYGVHLGAGKKRGFQLQILSAFLAAVAIIVTEKFIFDYFLNDYIRQNPAEFPNFPAGQSVSISFFEPEFWTSLFSPMGLLIYAIGIYIAFTVCKPRKL